MKKEHIIVDTDPGIDDAGALFMLLSSPNISVDLIVVGSGNLKVERTAANAIHITELLGKSVPVVCGLNKPLFRDSEYAESVHGEGGLGDYVYKPSKTKPIKQDFLEAMEEKLIANGELGTTILALGPLTNVAFFLMRKAHLRKYIKRIVFMGGSKDEIFSDKPYPEFNIAFDPEAANIMLSSEIPCVMIPMDFGHTAYFNKEEIEYIASLSEMGQIFKKMFASYKDGHVKEGAATHDPCAAAFIINPKLVKLERAFISVKFFKDPDVGCIKCDLYNLTKRVVNNVGMDINHEKFKNLFYHLVQNAKVHI